MTTLGGHADSARSDLAQARGGHVLEGLGPGAPALADLYSAPQPQQGKGGILVPASLPRARQYVLDALVRAEEEGGAGRGPDDGGPDAAVHAAEAAGREEAGARLETGLERVEGEEGEVDRGACYAAGEEGRDEGGVGCWLRRHEGGGMCIYIYIYIYVFTNIRARYLLAPFFRL